MAQWARQFSGVTHATKAQEIEHSLRQAIANLKPQSEGQDAKSLMAIQRLADRLLAARLKTLRARIADLTQPTRSNQKEAQIEQLRLREQHLLQQTVEDILGEFNYQASKRQSPKRA